MTPANMAARATALIIDGIITFLVLGEAIALLTGQTNSVGFGFHLSGGPALTWLVLAFAYWIVLEWMYGTTVGKRLFSIRVVGRDGTTPTFGQSLGRNILRLVDGFPYLLPYLIGFIVAQTDGERRRLGDRAAGTRVVSGAPTKGPTAEPDAEDGSAAEADLSSASEVGEAPEFPSQ